jgi:hypothetical protein
MPKDKTSAPKGSLANLFSDINDEIEEEKFAGLSSDDQVLETIARDILRLERDMTIPGSPKPDNVRIDSLMKFIEERDF